MGSTETVPNFPSYIIPQNPISVKPQGRLPFRFGDGQFRCVKKLCRIRTYDFVYVPVSVP